MTRRQLLELGYSGDAVDHRIEKGRLHRVFDGVYAVGRPELTQHGRWMAAVLACGRGAALSHEDGGALLGFRAYREADIEVSVPLERRPCHRGIRVHRRNVELEIGTCDRIPVTSPIDTIIDLAPRLARAEIEQMINEADKRDLADPETLRAAVERCPGRPGVGKLRAILDRHTFVLTESELERLFLPIVERAGLARPQTQRYLDGHRVDFFWPDLGLVVEVDGLRYHRTPAQQARDAFRDHTHFKAGLTPLRFTYWQIRHEPAHVEAVLRAAVKRLARV